LLKKPSTAVGSLGLHTNILSVFGMIKNVYKFLSLNLSLCPHTVDDLKRIFVPGII
jgi:hypothetical protein